MAKKKTTRQRYAERVDKDLRAFQKREDAAVRKVLQVVNSTRKRVVQDLQNAKGFDEFFLPELNAAINQTVENMRAEMQEIVDEELGASWDAGQDSVNVPLNDVLNVQVNVPRLPDTLFNAIAASTAELVTDVTTQTRNVINTQVQFGVTGVLRPFEVQKEIERALRTQKEDVNGKPGRRSVAAKAERIVRTEMNRTFNVANHETMNEAGNLIPDLKKEWLTVGDDRVRDGVNSQGNHVKLNGEVRKMNERFSNGLRYPLDPSGPPEEVVNCRCRIIAFRDNWDEDPEPKGVLELSAP